MAGRLELLVGLLMAGRRCAVWQAALKTEFYLWKLYHIDHDTAAAATELEKLEDGLAVKGEVVAEVEGQVKEKRRAQAGLSKQRMLLEKKVQKMRLDIDDQVGHGAPPRGPAHAAPAGTHPRRWHQDPRTYTCPGFNYQRAPCGPGCHHPEPVGRGADTWGGVVRRGARRARSW